MTPISKAWVVFLATTTPALDAREKAMFEAEATCQKAVAEAETKEGK